jgi:uncharacterized membrane protein YkvA (DUF1232 family)
VNSLLLAAAVAVALYGAAVLVLVLLGRRGDARALAGFIPDCLILFKRLIADSRVPRGRKVLLGAMLAYLAMPFDVVPDFIPVAGQLDDAILVGLVLRAVLRGPSRDLLGRHWPGPPQSLAVIERFAHGSPRRPR